MIITPASSANLPPKPWTAKKRIRLLAFATAISVTVVLLILGAAYTGAFGVDRLHLTGDEKAQLHHQEKPGLVIASGLAGLTIMPHTIVLPDYKLEIDISTLINHFAFPVIANKSRRFLLDTGCWGCAIDPYLALKEKLPIVPGSSFTGSGVGGSVPGAIGILPHLALGNLEIQDLPVMVLIDSIGFKLFWIRVGRVDGILGNSFFSNFVCTFDLMSHKLTLCLPKYFNPVKDLPHLIDGVPFRIDSQGHIALSVKLGGCSYPANLDLGAEGGLCLPLSVWRSLNLATNGVSQSTGIGPDKEKTLKAGTVAIGLGKATVNLPSSCFPDSQQNEIFIGSNLFEMFRLTIDYPRGMIYLEDRASPKL